MKKIPHFNEETDRIDILKFPRVYAMDVVLALYQGRKEIYSLEKIKVVLNRDGILRIEQNEMRIKV